MGFSELYNFEELYSGIQGWNAILASNFEKVEASLSIISSAELGEDITGSQAVYMDSSGKLMVVSDENDPLALGIMIESGLITETKRYQTRGLITYGSWSWTDIGKPVYIDVSTPGALTQTKPKGYSQAIGVVYSATSIFLMPTFISDSFGFIKNKYLGVLPSNQILEQFISLENITFPVDLEGSFLYAGIAPTASTVLSIQKNGTEFCTATFSPNKTIDATAAVDKTGGEVGIPLTSHGLAAGTYVIISGTINYDGKYLINSTTTNEIVITATYTAETFAGTELIILKYPILSGTLTSLEVSDILSVVAPATADVSLANVSWNLKYLT